MLWNYWVTRFKMWLISSFFSKIQSNKSKRNKIKKKSSDNSKTSFHQGFRNSISNKLLLSIIFRYSNIWTQDFNIQKFHSVIISLIFFFHFPCLTIETLSGWASSIIKPNPRHILTLAWRGQGEEGLKPHHYPHPRKWGQFSLALAITKKVSQC